MAKGRKKRRGEKWMLDRAFVATVLYRKGRAEVNSGYLKGVWAEVSPLIPYAKCRGSNSRYLRSCFWESSSEEW